MRKFKMFVDFEEEEKWLGEKAKEGWILKKRGIFYKFEKIAPDELVYSVDYRRFNSKDEYINYITMYKDFGWKHILGSRYSLEQYFVAKNNIDNPPRMYSDDDSNAKRYRKRGEGALVGAVVYISLFMVITKNYIGIKNFEWLIHPSSAFFTPGLWDKVGAEFLRAFLFELPFAFFRILSIVFILGFIIYMLVMSYWYFKLEKKKRNRK